MNKIKVALLRGAFLNPNELANYEKITWPYVVNSFSSFKPLGESMKIPNHKLLSPYDYPMGGATKYLLNRLIGDPHWLIGLKSKLQSFQIIDTADPYYYYSYQAALFKKKHSQTKLICTYCETVPHQNEGTSAKKRIKHFTLKQTDLFIVHTKRSFGCLQKEGVSEKKIRLVRLGVSLSKFKPRASTKNNLLFVGRLVPEKGIMVLLQAYIQLVKEFPLTKLKIVGQGPLEAEIKKICHTSNLQNNVEVLSQNYDQIYKEYQSAAIFVLPSYQTKTWEEQYGMALIEAMASGKAIVTTNCGAIPEVVGKDAIICKQNNIGSLYKSLRLLLTHPDKKRLLARKSRQRAEKYYNRNSFADKIRNIYGEALNCYPGKKRSQ
jgi:glycosyltransferase involved in cell wall biosynthesis